MSSPTPLVRPAGASPARGPADRLDRPLLRAMIRVARWPISAVVFLVELYVVVELLIWIGRIAAPLPDVVRYPAALVFAAFYVAVTVSLWRSVGRQAREIAGA